MVLIRSKKLNTIFFCKRKISVLTRDIYYLEYISLVLTHSCLKCPKPPSVIVLKYLLLGPLQSASILRQSAIKLFLFFLNKSVNCNCPLIHYCPLILTARSSTVCKHSQAVCHQVRFVSFEHVCEYSVKGLCIVVGHAEGLAKQGHWRDALLQ